MQPAEMLELSFCFLHLLIAL